MAGRRACPEWYPADRDRCRVAERRGALFQRGEAARTHQTFRNLSVKIVALGGSLRTNSFSAAALRAGLTVAARLAATTEMLDLRLLDLPLYVPDMPDERATRCVTRSVEELLKFRPAKIDLSDRPISRSRPRSARPYRAK